MGEIQSDEILQEQIEDMQRVPDMLEINRFFMGEKSNKINFREVAAALPKSVKEMISSRFDMKNFAKIFEDLSMMKTVETFLDCGMNVSVTSRELYMHRNTLIYRLKMIYRNTGLDLYNFRDAVAFEFLHYLYMVK